MNPFKRGDKIRYSTTRGRKNNGKIIDLFYNPIDTYYKSQGWILLIELDDGSTIEKHESRITKI